MRRWSLPVMMVGSVLLAGVAPADDPTSSQETTPFVIGIEDVLRIVVWGEDKLSMTVQVRPDGKITLPLVHDVDVVGQTPEQVRKRLTEALGQFVRDPNVTVIVEQFNSYRVYFLGEVSTQGPVQLFRPTRLLQGVASAGGMTEFAKKEITLLREEGGVEKRLSIDYKKLLAGEGNQENLMLKAGDIILCK